MITTDVYTLHDIKDITNNGFSYKLPLETINIIKEMCDNMNVLFSPLKVRDFSEPIPNSYSNSKNRYPSKRGGGGGGGSQSHVTDGDWELLRSFKPSVLPKSEGIDKTINNIRICLNKVSPKNVDAQFEVLLENIRSIFGLYDLDSPEIKKTISTIFDICSLNKFYSEIYAGIYSKLISQYPIFYDFLYLHFTENFLVSFEKIKCVDSNEDYDAFCLYNKENDNRKANTMFFIQLMKLQVFEKSTIIMCIQQLLKHVFCGIKEEGRINEIEEITENIYIFMKNTAEELSTEQEWDDIMEKIQELAQMKHNLYPSISNRAIFKYMDITD